MGEKKKTILEQFAELFKPSPETIGKKTQTQAQLLTEEVDRQGNVIKKVPNK